MKIRKTIIIFVSLLLLSMSMFSQDVQISYLEGLVELIRGNQIYEAYIGDIISLDSQLRLLDGAQVELERDGSRVFLNTPGTFSIRRLFSADNQGSQGVLGSLSRRISSLNSTDEETRGNSSTAGVRASEAVENTIEWAGTDMGDLFEEGFDALQMGQLDQAYYAFEEAYFLASDAELSEAAYYLGYTAILQGNLEEGAELYQEVSLEAEDGQLYYLFLLSSADLHLKLGDYTQVIQTVSAVFNSEVLNPADIQLAYYYRAMAYAGLGDLSSRDSDLRQVTEINANPQLTAVAEEILWKED
jgi:tetratricopeptide (TPR) repeat protein